MEPLKLVHAKVADELAKMSRLFKPQCKLAFVMRDPDNVDGYMVVSDDSVEEIIGVLNRSKELDPKELTHDDIVASRMLG